MQTGKTSDPKCHFSIKCTTQFISWDINKECSDQYSTPEGLIHSLICELNLTADHLFFMWDESFLLCVICKSKQHGLFSISNKEPCGSVLIPGSLKINSNNYWMYSDSIVVKTQKENSSIYVWRLLENVLSHFVQKSGLFFCFPLFGIFLFGVNSKHAMLFSSFY